MCGLVGAINWGDIDLVREMNEVQFHRGPDDGGEWTTQANNGATVALGSRRLSIRDLSTAGHMPMTTADGQHTIVYNGEIYNEAPLRNDLESRGIKLVSGSDTEIALNLYKVYGEECVKQLNGMFAFAIWDNNKQQLFLARDQIGIKPLYITQRSDQFAFASEIKSLLKLPSFEKKLNVEALDQYLSFLWVPDPLTMLNGVVKLPAGHCAVYKDGQYRQWQYWDLEFPASNKFDSEEPRANQNHDELIAEIKERFDKTVKSQMVSDVPVGAFLSAGLDSSSIVASMAKQTKESIRTFTVTFPEKYRQAGAFLDDPAVAERTAAHFGCTHTELEVDPSVVDLLPKLVWHMDEPTADPAIITAYLVNEAASEHVKVLLSGVGGDELFAGYRKYQAYFLAKKYQRIPSSLRQLLIEPLVSALPPLQGTKAARYVRLAKKMVRTGSMDLNEQFIANGIYLTREQKAAVLTEAMHNNTRHFNPAHRHESYFEKVAHCHPVNKMLYADTKAFMCSLNLNYNDKMSMACSVEVRVPFLDHEFASWVASNVPPELKLTDKVTKHALREAMRSDLPAEVLKQQKAGFAAPIEHWLTHDLHEMTQDLLSAIQVKKRGIFKPESVQAMLQEHTANKRDWSMQIWQILTLELWMQRFIDE